MENKLTAVHWLYRWFNDNPESTIEEAHETYVKAQELEKKEHQQTFMAGGKNGYNAAMSNNFITFEQYWNERKNQETGI